MARSGGVAESDTPLLSMQQMYLSSGFMPAAMMSIPKVPLSTVIMGGTSIAP